MNERTRRWVAVGGLSLVALLTRTLVASGSGLWRDEALFLFITRSETWGGVIDFLQRHESHPPLFYAVMRLWLAITGDTDTAALALPVALGVALVPIVYVVGRSLFSSRCGLLAAALVALSPSLTQFSAQVRPYSLLPILALLSSFSLIRGTDRGDRTAWGGYVVSTAALLYTHNWGWLLLLAQIVVVGALVARGLSRGRTKVVREWLLALVIVGAAYLPWLPSFIYQARHAGHPGLALAGWSDVAIFLTLATRAFLQSTILAYSAGDGLASGSRWLVVLPLLVLILALLLRLSGRTSASTPESRASVSATSRVALATLLFVPVVAWAIALMLSSHSNLVLPRCLVMLAPSLLLAVALFLAKRDQQKVGAIALAAALVVTYIATDLGLTQSVRSNAREVARHVAARTNDSDLVIVAPEWLASSFNRYYSPNVEQIDFPHFGREGAVDLTGLRERTLDPRALALIRGRINEMNAAGRRVWLIIDASYVRDLSTADTLQPVQKLDFGEAGTLRANQIRAELRNRYGEPDSSLTRVTRTPQYEDLRAYLFTPNG